MHAIVNYQSDVAKRARDRLFKISRPYFRKFDWARDFWVLWAAYDLQSFEKMDKDLSRDQFAEQLQQVQSRHSSLLIAEDDNKYFKAKRGPVAIIAIDNYGWRIEPHVDFFRWASPRCRLRSYVAFFQMLKNADEFGVAIVRAPKRFATFIEQLTRYCPIHACGMVPNGSIYGDEYLFSIESRRARYGQRSRLERKAA